MTEQGESSAVRRPSDHTILPESPSPSPRTPKDSLTATGHGMLSVDFCTPLAGPARTERIKHMARNHAAFEKSRQTQEILVKAQHALRRMPGVSGQEAKIIVAQLQEVGQIVNQETVQLVDALMNLALDQEDTDKAIARMSIEAHLSEAKNDEQAQTISDLRAKVADAEKKREELESELEQIRDSAPANDIGSWKGRTAKCSERMTQDDLFQDLVARVREVEKRYMMNTSFDVPMQGVIQKNASPLDDGNGSHFNHQSLQRAVMPYTEPAVTVSGAAGRGSTATAIRAPDHQGLSNSAYSSLPSRTSSGLPLNRSSTVAPPKFGPLQTAPPRAPAAFAQERRFQQGSWGTCGPGRFVTGSNNFITGSAFSQQPRVNSFQPLSRYRANSSDYFAHGLSTRQENGPSRPNSSYGVQREQPPATPTSAHRRRFGRYDEARSGDSGETSGSTSVLVNRSSLSVPPIHLTERAIAAWNEQIMDFYAMIRVFVERHAGEPDNGVATEIMQSSIWPILLATYHPLSESEATSYLDFHLRNENAKACVVTRVIIDYVVNRVWVPGAWTGSDSKTTYDLMELEQNFEAMQAHPVTPVGSSLPQSERIAKQKSNLGQASTARQPLLNQQATIVGQILKNEQGTRWHKAKVDEITRTLQRTVQPLVNKQAAVSETQRDLEPVAELAWELSSKMLTSRLTFDFRFPEIGSRFSSQSMLPIWPLLDPSELQAKHWRVAFVTTPVITCRNDTGGGISAHSVAMADVFCMQ